MLAQGTLLRNGTYRVERQLASGGFGNTYLVKNVAFNELYAMKEFFMRGVNMRNGMEVTVSIPDNHTSYDSQREKFKKEAIRLRSLNNPHIVKVHDLFEENSTVYYIMDYIDGQSIGEQLKRTGQPMSEQQTWTLLPQVLNALKEVHSQQIWHLDIKPGNIMLDSKGNAFLIDFGASKQISSNGSQTSSALCYTPGYAPVEQVEQAFDKFGPWTDFYALGATIYYMQTLQAPPTATALSEGDAFNFPASMSKRMQDLIRWMMKPQRKLRPQSVDDITSRFLTPGGSASGAPVLEGRPRRPEVMGKPPLRFPDDRNATCDKDKAAPRISGLTGAADTAADDSTQLDTSHKAGSRPASGGVSTGAGRPAAGGVTIGAGRPAAGGVTIGAGRPAAGGVNIGTSQLASGGNNTGGAEPAGGDGSGGGKSSSKWWILLVLLLLAGLGAGAYFMFFNKSSEEKAAESDQEEYETMVAKCRSAFGDAASFSELEDAKTTYFPDIKEMEEEYGDVMPETYNKYDDLKELYEQTLEHLRDGYIDKAAEYFNGDQFSEAFAIYDEAIEALPDDEELAEKRNSQADKIGNIIVTDIQYGNNEDDTTILSEPGETLYTDDMRFLCIYVVYNSLLPEGNSSERREFKYRLYYPDGHLDKSDNSPTGYTFSGSFLIAPGEVNQREKLTIWGLDSKSNYPAGTYRMELFYDDTQVFQNTFVVRP